MGHKDNFFHSRTKAIKPQVHYPPIKFNATNYFSFITQTLYRHIHTHTRSLLERMAGGGGNNEERRAVESGEWYLAAYAPEGVPSSDHLKLRTVPLSLDVDTIPDGQIIVETLFISVDPYQRTRMTGLEDGLYFSQFSLNQVLFFF